MFTSGSSADSLVDGLCAEALPLRPSFHCFLSEPLGPWWLPRAGVGGSDFSVALAIIVLICSRF